MCVFACYIGRYRWLANYLCVCISSVRTFKWIRMFNKWIYYINKCWENTSKIHHKIVRFDTDIYTHKQQRGGVDWQNTHFYRANQCDQGWKQITISHFLSKFTSKIWLFYIFSEMFIKKDLKLWISPTKLQWFPSKSTMFQEWDYQIPHFSTHERG